MSKAKKPVQRNKPVLKKSDVSAKVEQKNTKRELLAPLKRTIAWKKSLTPRSPHQSFRRTYRRDYVRSLEMPGYIAFTVEVWRTLWRYKNTIGLLVIAYAILTGLLVGIASQSTYSQISELIRTTGGELFQGNVGKITEAGVLLLAGLSGGISPSMGEVQQLISGLLVLLIWLTTIWLLRAFLAGNTPRLRDGLYNSAAPLVPTIILSLFLLVQLIPVAVGSIALSAAIPTGLISGGVEAMLFWVVVILLAVLSLYWVTSTFFALVVVTLPGMYPLRALKTAHELVVGRRVRVVLRLVWLSFVTLLAWALVMIPTILFDAWLKWVLPAIEWVPIVPLALLIVSSASVVWVASYIYLLYRKVVDDDSAPA